MSRGRLSCLKFWLVDGGKQDVQLTRRYRVHRG